MMITLKRLPVLFLTFLCFTQVSLSQKKKITTVNTPQTSRPWSNEKANAWYAAQPWIIGADYLPSNAINQLEMWQAETFDSTLNDKELGYAQGIGFNTLRVYLHSIAWKTDKEGFKKRMNTFLTIADKHGIKPVFVFFDDCWLKEGKPGTQPIPKPGVHNSGWVQDPGDPYSNDSTNFPALEVYVKDVLTAFKNDKRILLWDLYNEPGNSGKKNKTVPLLKNIFRWAKEVDPVQPVSAGLWAWDFDSLNQIQIANSDVITYHDYEEAAWHQRTIDLLKAFGKPLICTEYMARTRNSRFSTILPILKEENVGAINWGFVTGKSNTKYAWDTPITDGSEPGEWFHDIFWPDGTPYRKDEIDLIKKLDGAANKTK